MPSTPFLPIRVPRESLSRHSLTPPGDLMSARSLFIIAVLCSIVALLSLAVLAYCEFVATPNLEASPIPTPVRAQAFEEPSTVLEEAFFDTGAPIQDTGVFEAEVFELALEDRRESFSKLWQKDPSWYAKPHALRDCIALIYIVREYTFEASEEWCKGKYEK